MRLSGFDGSEIGAASGVGRGFASTAYVNRNRRTLGTSSFVILSVDCGGANNLSQCMNSTNSAQTTK